MNDLVFVVDEDQILHRRASALREERLRRLELRAMVEEVEEAEKQELDRFGIRSTSRNNYVYGSDAYRHIPGKAES